ncbi:MAG: hypothetical protein CVT80_06350 [Alphaproteobacteria bacterium HGW-Alphaproteobacteria-2]|nr:MAG: hypothetical protein CVT80_06350 [Alphaproteobacteria bacterium HGW-Alphaproteobacteria-2]
MTDNTNSESDLVAFAAELVSSYVAANQIPASELPALIRKVHETLSELSGGRPAAAAEEAESAPPPRSKPAVPVSKSVTPDAIICLEDGKSFKTLKRHLKTSYNMTTARRIGLGRKV